MTLFFWDYFDQINPISSTILVIINLFSLIFCIRVLVRLSKFISESLFEIGALLLASFGLFLLLLFKLFQWDYQLAEISILFEILLYGYFCYSFGIMYLQFSKAPTTRRKYLTIIVFASILLFGFFVILAFNNISTKNCQIVGLQFSLAGLTVQLFYSIPTIYFGLQIRKNIQNIINNIQQKVQQSLKEKLTIHVQQKPTDLCLMERDIQVKLVLIGYGVALIGSSIIVILIGALSHICLSCLLVEGCHIIVGINLGGHLLLFLKGIIQMVPFIIIPIGVYHTPTKVRIKAKNICLNDEIVDEKQDSWSKEMYSQSLGLRLKESAKLKKQNLEKFDKFEKLEESQYVKYNVQQDHQLAL